MTHSRIATRTALMAVMAVAALSGNARAGENKEGDIQYGRTPEGRLKLIFLGGTTALPVIDSGPLTGWGLDEPGFFSIVDPIPEENIVPLDSGNNIVVQVVGAGLDNGLKAWLPGFGAHLGNGPLSVASWDLGPDFQDGHPFWHIDPTTAGFVMPPSQLEWTATLRIIDTGATGYLPSDPITVSFAPVPEPGSLTMLALAGIVVTRRSRRVRVV